MGSVGGEVESQPSLSDCNKYKLPRKLLVDSGAVNHDSIPRKLRSAIKKRVRVSVTSPLSISKKNRHVEKDGVTKSKPKKRGHISKDEEEVAETLFALASMFSEPINKKSPTILETGSSMNAVEDVGMPAVREESTKINSEVILESTCHSPNLMDSKAQIVKSQSSSGAKKRDVIDLEHVPASEAQFGNNYYPTDDTYNETGYQCSETQRSCQRLPGWLKSTNFASKQRVTENNISTEKCLVAVQSNKSWKRSSAHVYISRLIKVLQITEKNDERSPEKPAQLTSFNDIIVSAVEKGPSEIKNDIFPHKRLIQDRQLASETSTLYSAKDGYNFLSLGMELNRAGPSYAAPRQVHASYAESQKHPSMLFSLPQNGYSSSYKYGDNSALAAQQVQAPQYLSSCSTITNGNYTARMGLQQQKRADQIRDQYNTVGVGSSHIIPDWRNEKTESTSTHVNCAQALFPNLMGSTKYQQFIPPSEQQRRLASIDSSFSLPNVKMNQHRQFPLGFQRNGGPAFYYGNAHQFLR
ncbi:hypothetical protein CASFOL_016971 [Castilleja foliolosa]|uniref:Uncharacterized protein n=1 Tax=Castilleja foliolosa TaxID=1961234 RepID=A0ABD3DCZ1_9LAMI